MQDRYVADVGDFGKYGLLRALTLGRNSHSGLRLAILWYFVPDECHNEDGRHITYLTNPTHTTSFDLCDSELFAAMRRIVDDRRVVTIERGGILRKDTRFHREPLVFDRHESIEARHAKRRKWLQGAAATAEGADIVFLDPDNGLECRVRAHSRVGPKYVYYSDLQVLHHPSRSLVIYHHLSRQGTASEQICERAEILASVVPTTHQIAALRFRRGSARAYFLIVAAPHVTEVQSRLEEMLYTSWSKHFVWEPLPTLGLRALTLKRPIVEQVGRVEIQRSGGGRSPIVRPP